MTRAPHARRGRATLPVLALLTALALSSCSGSDGAGDGGSGSGSEDAASGAEESPSGSAAAASGYLPVPDEVSLTEPGSELEHGQSATVAWELAGGEVGVLDLSVERVREVRRSAFAGWLAGDSLRTARPYFVDVSVENRGSSDLGGEVVPLYLLDGETLVPPSSFRGRFKPCASRPLPQRFVEDDEAELCLVYLVPRRGKVEAMSFDPVEGFEAITWRGKVSRPGQARGDDKGDKGDRDDKDDKDDKDDRDDKDDKGDRG